VIGIKVFAHSPKLSSKIKPQFQYSSYYLWHRVLLYWAPLVSYIAAGQLLCIGLYIRK